MNEPTEEEQVRLWEWCGLVHVNNPIPTEVANSCEAIAMDKPLNGWYYPDYTKGTSKLISLREVPVLDLNSLFKWAVPKVVKILGDTDLSSNEEAMWKLFGLWLKVFWEPRTEPISIGDALFWAIYKVIEND